MNDAAVRIQLLGGFTVSAGGAAIPEAQWKSRRARSLVKLLALAPGHRLHRDQVIESLWPESDFSAASNNFHQTLYAARKIFDTVEAVCLSLKDGLLSLGDDLSVDVEQFEAAAARAKGSQDPQAYQDAVALYTGDLLPEDPYEEWTIQRREALKQVYLHLLLDLAQLYETRQDYPPAIEALLRLLESDRSHEEAHAGLMRLYALSGQRQQALRQYQALRDALQAELDAEPGESTTQLYEAIQAGRFSPTPPPEAPTRRHNLPAQLTSFIGREKQIAEVRRLVIHHRLVTLTGSGGTGKTRLALKAAEGLLEHFFDGVFLVELAPLSDPDLVPKTCLQALELVDQPGVPPQVALASYLEKKEMLLILDNCEHVIAACTGMAAALLKACPNLHILATSREILSIPGEHPFRVPSLQVPDPLSLPPLAELAQVEAVRLFVERAAQVAPDMELTPVNAGAIARIGQRLDGIPLAIELAAARVRLLTVEQVAVRLDDTFRLLTGGSKAVLPRQQTLKAMIDWSYDLLSPKERLLLQRLSVFAGGWTLEAAEAVCADEVDEPACSAEQLGSFEVMDVLAQLVDKSLVIAEPGEYEARYRLLETIRQYARERLLESGCSRQVRDRHLETFARLSGEAEPHLRGSGQVEWLERLDQELDNVRAALEWSLSSRVELGLKIAADLMWFWHLRTLFNEAFEWTEKLLEAETEKRGEQPLAGERALQRARGMRAFAYLSANFASGMTDIERLTIFQDSAAILRMLGAAARRELGISLLYVYFYETFLVRPSYIREEMLEIFHQEKERFYLSEYLFNTESYAEDLDQAIELQNTSLAISREIEDLDGISGRSAHLGYLLKYKGDYAQAGALLHEALEITRIVKNYRHEANIHDLLARLALAQGKYMEATHLAETAISKYQVLNYLGAIIVPLQTLQQIAWSQGNYAASVQYAQENIATYLRQHRGNIIELYLGRAAVSQGDLAQAEVHLRRALPSGYWDWWNIPAIHILGWIALFRQQGKYPDCARLIGAVDSIYHQVAPGLIPRERSEFEEDCAAARAALGEEAFAAAFNEGQALTQEQALEYVLAKAK